MSGMEMSHGHMKMNAGSLIDLMLEHATAGTDAEPDSTPSEMLMTQQGKWLLMFHGVAFFADIQQTGPRGKDKIFAPTGSCRWPSASSATAVSRYARC
jgi:hypothetical protein